MPVVISACQRELEEEYRHKKNEPGENHVWLEREHVPIEIEVVTTKRVVASKNNRDKKPKQEWREKEAPNEYPEASPQLFGCFQRHDQIKINVLLKRNRPHTTPTEMETKANTLSSEA